MYTGQITFANLASQDVATSEKDEVQDGCSQGERKSPQDPEWLSAPPPTAVVVGRCSPKSVYCLANEVRLAPLRSDAVTDSPPHVGRPDWTLRCCPEGYSIQVG